MAKIDIPPPPKLLKDSIGDEATHALGQWFGDILEINSVSRNDYNQIWQRLGKVETELQSFRSEVNQRFDTVHQRFDNMQENFNQRIDHLQENFNQRIENLQENFNQRIDRLQENFNQRTEHLHENFNQRNDMMYERLTTMIKWTVGTLALFGTLITILLAISQFVKL